MLMFNNKMLYCWLILAFALILLLLQQHAAAEPAPLGKDRAKRHHSNRILPVGASDASVDNSGTAGAAAAASDEFITNANLLDSYNDHKTQSVHSEKLEIQSENFNHERSQSQDFVAPEEKLEMNQLKNRLSILEQSVLRLETNSGNTGAGKQQVEEPERNFPARSLPLAGLGAGPSERQQPQQPVQLPPTAPLPFPNNPPPPADQRAQPQLNSNIPSQPERNSNLGWNEVPSAGGAPVAQNPQVPGPGSPQLPNLVGFPLPPPPIPLNPLSYPPNLFLNGRQQLPNPINTGFGPNNGDSGRARNDFPRPGPDTTNENGINHENSPQKLQPQIQLPPPPQAENSNSINGRLQQPQQLPPQQQQQFPPLLPPNQNLIIPPWITKPELPELPQFPTPPQ